MASFVNMSGKAPERSNFAKTCNLLSQYLKGRFTSLGDVCQLGIDGKLESTGSETSRPPAAAAATTTTMNMLPNLEKVCDPHHNEDSSSIGKSAQMTIFFGGRVIVFDDFPADKAKQIMSLASNSNGFVPASVKEVHIPRSPAATASNNAPDPIHLRPQANGSGLPIARRASLHRFLDKRKGRITSKAPYQINSPPAATSKSAGESNPQLEPEGLSSKQLELKL